MLKSLAAAAITGIAIAMVSLAACGAESAANLPAPAFDPRATQGTQTAVLSGGCFWAWQGVYQHLKGVKNVLAGYAGGERATADLRDREWR